MDRGIAVMAFLRKESSEKKETLEGGRNSITMVTVLTCNGNPPPV